MSVQSQIDRITNEVGTQADLIAQISEALESKGGVSATMGAETLKGNTDSLNAVLEQVNSLSASDPVLQEKTVSPTTSKQTVTPDNSYDGLSKVTVNAMPEATQATPSIEISSAGLITAKATQSAGYVAAGTKQATKQLTTQAAKTVTPGKSDQTAVASGRYTTGAIIVKGDSALEPGNIKSGVSIFGVPGSYTGSGGGGGSGGGDNAEIDGLITHEITQVVNSRVTSVGTYVFRECYKLTRAILPNVTTMGNYAFYNCYVLSDIDFSELTTIGNYSLSGCKVLVKADFPKVTKIGTYAFNKCTAMTALILRSPTVATLGNTAALDVTPIKSGTGYIYVPSALVDSYKAASNWSTYAEQIRAIEDYPDITGG
jgi:hypothetical protein